MAIENARLGPIVNVRPAVAAGVRQLYPNEQLVVGTNGFAMLLDQHRSQAREIHLACEAP